MPSRSRSVGPLSLRTDTRPKLPAPIGTPFLALAFSLAAIEPSSKPLALAKPLPALTFTFPTRLRP